MGPSPAMFVVNRIMTGTTGKALYSTDADREYCQI